MLHASHGQLLCECSPSVEVDVESNTSTHDKLQQRADLNYLELHVLLVHNHFIFSKERSQQRK